MKRTTAKKMMRGNPITTQSHQLLSPRHHLVVVVIEEKVPLSMMPLQVSSVPIRKVAEIVARVASSVMVKKTLMVHRVTGAAILDTKTKRVL